jgi:hypothetical protein
VRLAAFDSLAAGIVFDATVIRALLVPVDDDAARPLELVAAGMAGLAS